MSAVIIGAIPWEKLIEQAAEPPPVRPRGSFTFEEWRQRTGKGRDTSTRMLRRLIDAGTIRVVEGQIAKNGRSQRTVFYVPCAPQNSPKAT